MSLDIVVLRLLRGHNPHHIQGRADQVGWALLAFGPFGIDSRSCLALSK
jgi:hypothetical protein